MPNYCRVARQRSISPLSEPSGEFYTEVSSLNYYHNYRVPSYRTTGIADNLFTSSKKRTALPKNHDNLQKPTADELVDVCRPSLKTKSDKAENAIDAVDLETKYLLADITTRKKQLSEAHDMLKELEILRGKQQRRLQSIAEMELNVAIDSSFETKEEDTEHQKSFLSPCLSLDDLCQGNQKWKGSEDSMDLKLKDASFQGVLEDKDKGLVDHLELSDCKDCKFGIEKANIKQEMERQLYMKHVNTFVDKLTRALEQERIRFNKEYELREDLKSKFDSLRRKCDKVRIDSRKKLDKAKLICKRLKAERSSLLKENEYLKLSYRVEGSRSPIEEKHTFRREEHRKLLRSELQSICQKLKEEKACTEDLRLRINELELEKKETDKKMCGIIQELNASKAKLASVEATQAQSGLSRRECTSFQTQREVNEIETRQSQLSQPGTETEAKEVGYLRNKVSNLNKNNSKLVNENEELVTLVDKLKDRNRKLKLKVGKLEKSQLDLKRKQDEIVRRRSRENAETSPSERKENELDTQLRSRVTELEKVLQGKVFTINKLDKTVSELNDANKDLTCTNADLIDENTSLRQLCADYDDLMSLNRKRNREIEKLKEEVNVLKNSDKENMEHLATMVKEGKRLGQEVSRLQAEKFDLQCENERIRGNKESNDIKLDGVSPLMGKCSKVVRIPWNELKHVFQEGLGKYTELDWVGIRHKLEKERMSKQSSLIGNVKASSEDIGLNVQQIDSEFSIAIDMEESSVDKSNGNCSTKDENDVVKSISAELIKVKSEESYENRHSDEITRKLPNADSESSSKAQIVLEETSKRLSIEQLPCTSYSSIKDQTLLSEPRGESFDFEDPFFETEVGIIEESKESQGVEEEVIIEAVDSSLEGPEGEKESTSDLSGKEPENEVNNSLDCPSLLSSKRGLSLGPLPPLVLKTSTSKSHDRDEKKTTKKKNKSVKFTTDEDGTEIDHATRRKAKGEKRRKKENKTLRSTMADVDDLLGELLES